MDNIDATSIPQSFCPSAQPEMAGSMVLGVVEGKVDEPRVGYLAQPLPVTHELLSLSGSVEPTEIFRFAAPCASSACQHFDGSHCRLAKRVVLLFPAVVEVLPACRLRSKCRWWRQEGRAACLRCPQIVTRTCHPSEQQRQVANPLA